MATFQIMRAAGNRPLRSTGRKIYGKNVSVISTIFPNGCSYRMPWAVSRDLQKAAISGKELYFRVTHTSLKDTSHSGNVQTGFDFEFQTLSGGVLPYVIKSYDGATGTLFGVLNCSPVGSTGATRGWFYFGNPVWTGDRSNHDGTFPNAVVSLFLPSKIDQSGSALNFSADLPSASPTVIVNPGALCNGTTDETSRDLIGTCGDFLYAFLAQNTTANSDDNPTTIGNGTGNVALWMRHCFATPNGTRPPTDITNCWRAGFVTAAGASYYESAQNTADTSLQHVVFRRVTGQSLELYINGVLAPWDWKSEPGGSPQTGTIDFAGNKFFIGRGSTGNRYWNGYLDCVKLYKNDAKTASWAASEYANLSAINDAIIFGDPEALGGTSLWGEAIELACDGSATVDFDASKYSVADVGTVSVDTAVGSLVNPSGGTLAALTGNNVRYANSANQAGLDEGSVRLKNTAGSKIIVPARFIITVGTPPVSGYYKTPKMLKNDGTPKTKRVVTNRATLISELAKFSGASPTYTSATDYISIEGPIGAVGTKGSAISINVGGTVAHPLVITSPGAGTDVWGTRAGYKVHNSRLDMLRPYTWLYGLWLSQIPTEYQQYPNTDGADQTVGLGASNCMVTACRSTNSLFLQQLSNRTDNLIFCFNWSEKIFQAITSVGGGDTCVRSDSGSQTGTDWVIARNITSDGPGANDIPVSHSTPSNPINGSSNARFAYMSPGPSTFTGWVIEYNKLAASHSHYMEFKAGVKYVRWNHCEGGGNVYGGIYYRGSPPGGGEMSYNRVHCRLVNMNGPNTLILSNWYVDSGGAPTGQFGLTPHSVYPGHNDLTGADGTKLIGNKMNILMPYYFEPNNYNTADKLGSLAPVLIAGHLSPDASIQFGTVASGISPAGAITWDGNGHPTNGGSDLDRPHITKQSKVPPGYDLQTPPILDNTSTGPAAPGKVWGT